MSKIMVVDDEAYISTQLEERLTSMDYEVVGTASSGEGSISMAKSLSPDLVLMDIVMPGKLDGIEASEIITKELDIPVIFLTAYADDKFLERAKKVQAFGYILKPFQEKEIKANIELALYRKDKERHVITHRKLAEEKLTQVEEAKKYADTELEQIFNSIPAGIRLVDENFNVLKLNQAFSILSGISIKEAKGRKCYETFSCDLCNTPKCLLNRILGGSEHIEMEVEKKRIDNTVMTCIIMVTPFRGYRGNLIGMVENVTDTTMLKKVENELKDSLKELRQALRGIIQAMALIVETRDPYTAGHQRRVADLARAIAKKMGFPKDKIQGIRMAGALHDIGKIAIPSEILTKPGRLNGTEFDLIKNHPQVGYDILKSIKFPWPVAKIVLQHHERMDGSGYPQGLSGEDILPEARILGLADVVEAMASHRPYRPALGIDKALEEISLKRGILYDVEAVNACLKLFKDNRFKFKQAFTA